MRRDDEVATLREPRTALRLNRASWAACCWTMRPLTGCPACRRMTSTGPVSTG